MSDFIPRDGLAVRDPDGRRGVIRDVFRRPDRTPIGVKVAYPLGSPYLDDWTLFQPHELAAWEPLSRPAATLSPSAGERGAPAPTSTQNRWHYQPPMPDWKKKLQRKPKREGD